MWIAVQTISSQDNVIATHGLGLIVKTPKKDFQRISILSKVLTLFKGKPICVRLLDKIALTNSTKSDKVTTS